MPADELSDFGRLVELHYSAVVAVAYATTRDVGLAEDIAQDTFVAAWAAEFHDIAPGVHTLCVDAAAEDKAHMPVVCKEITVTVDKPTLEVTVDVTSSKP